MQGFVKLLNRNVIFHFVFLFAASIFCKQYHFSITETFLSKSLAVFPGFQSIIFDYWLLGTNKMKGKLRVCCICDTILRRESFQISSEVFRFSILSNLSYQLKIPTKCEKKNSIKIINYPMERWHWWPIFYILSYTYDRC